MEMALDRKIFSKWVKLQELFVKQKDASPSVFLVPYIVRAVPSSGG